MFSLRPLARAALPSQRRACLKCAVEIPRVSHRSLFNKAHSLRATFATQTASPSNPAPNATLPKTDNSPPNGRPKKRRRRLLITTAVLGALLGLVILTEDGQKAYTACRRTCRVINVLYANVRDYRDTLAMREDGSTSKEDYNEKLKACHQRCANRTLKAMEANGSVFIKLGQHLTSLNYLLPSEWCDTFIPLQDHCPVSPFPTIKRMVESDTGKPFSELFTTFDEQPLGAASLAQVHLATDAASGQRVAVKVQHPMLDDWAPLDLRLTKFTFQTLKRVFPEYDLTWLSDEMQVSLPQELDFHLEGSNATRAKEYFAPMRDIPLVIPRVFWSDRRVLVMEYVTGHRLDDLSYLETHNIDRDEVSASLSKLFNTMIFAPEAPLHCDPHGGNIAIRHNPAKRGKHNFDIILYDHGLYRTIPRQLQRDYARLWLAVLDADEPRMREAAHAVAGITPEQFPLFASAITGRDYRVVTRNVAEGPPTDAEREAMSDALGEGLLQQLVMLLGQVPRIILLILKTNDLTRSLDAKLQTKKGPMRSFLILARYAAQTVLEESLEGLRRASGSLFWPPTQAWRALRAWTRYGVVVGKLQMYESWLFLRGLMGLGNDMPGGNLMENAG